MPSFPIHPLLRSGLEAHVALTTELARRGVDALGQLSALNVAFAQQSLQDFTEVSRSMLASRDPFDAAAAAARTAQPTADHWRHYQRQLARLLGGVQVALVRGAGALAPQASRYAAAMAESLAQEADAAEQTGRGDRRLAIPG
jgi:phasin family protein